MVIISGRRGPNLSNTLQPTFVVWSRGLEHLTALEPNRKHESMESLFQDSSVTVWFLWNCSIKTFKLVQTFISTYLGCAYSREIPIRSLRSVNHSKSSVLAWCKSQLKMRMSTQFWRVETLAGGFLRPSTNGKPETFASPV